jgi:voltage-gated potassium channel Kch
MKQGRQPWRYGRHAHGAGTATLAPRARGRKVTYGDRLRYRVDNAFSRGTRVVILWLAAITAGIVVAASVVLTVFRAAVNDEKHVGVLEAFWQSLLRVIDPGTMASDSGWLLRIVALLVTLSGIFIASTLIGIIATGIDQKIGELRKGRSFVVEEGHTLVLGWSPRLFAIVGEIVEANANQSRSCIAILAGMDKVEMEDEVRARVGETRNTRIVCRRGDPTNPLDLEIVNAGGARSIIVLGGAEDDGDAEAVKSVLAVMARDPDLKQAHVVVELNDDRNAEVLRENSGGRVIPVQSTAVIAGVTAQACRQTGLSAVYQELLDFEGDEIYFQRVPELEGHPFSDALLGFEESAVLGIATSAGDVRLNPPMDTMFASGDSVIAISEDDDTVVFRGFAEADVTAAPSPDGLGGRQAEALLVVGWNSLGPRVLQELDQFVAPGSSVEVLVDNDLVDDDLVDPKGAAARGATNLDVTFTPTGGDPEIVTRTATTRSFDHIILLGYRSGVTPAEADARTLLTLLQLHRCLDRADGRPRIVAELLDSRDVELGRVTAADDLIVSDVLSSLAMAQLSERPELDAVFRDLFDIEGSSITLKPATAYLGNGSHAFASYVAAASAREEIVLGYRVASGGGLAGSGVVLNPPKSAPVDLGADGQLVVLSTRV